MSQKIAYDLRQMGLLVITSGGVCNSKKWKSPDVMAWLDDPNPYIALEVYFDNKREGVLPNKFYTMYNTLHPKRMIGFSEHNYVNTKFTKLIDDYLSIYYSINLILEFYSPNTYIDLLKSIESDINSLSAKSSQLPNSVNKSCFNDYVLSEFTEDELRDLGVDQFTILHPIWPGGSTST